MRDANRSVSRRAVSGGLLGAWALALGNGFVAHAASIPSSGRAARKFFTAEELRFVSAYADTLIPATDTPGAVAVGVPALLDHMMATWAGKATRTQLRTTLASMRHELDQSIGGTFAAAPFDDRVRTLAPVDARLFAAEPGLLPGPYRQFKVLVAKLYYATRVGATVELRYEPIPGDWKSDIPFSDVGRSWAVD
jgi:hypothetical protein